ncbi:MAG TPA: class I SAM-dependent methyltransferase [Polyangia bacterium]|nr:class I SAM-dependent methyltransferase [Polyangia bacterium]
MAEKESAATVSVSEIFGEIYRNDRWNGGSGPGSLPGVNRPYVRFIQSMLRLNDVRTVVDLGCGDWQFSRGIDWGTTEYLGLDVVPHIVERNRRVYGTPSVSFAVAPPEANQLPSADLLLVKDVFQHLSNRRVQEHVAVFPKFKYVLVTNCSKKSRHLLNTDIPDGGFRPLDLRLAPFGVPMASVLQYGTDRTLNLRRLAVVTPGIKQVFLWIRPDAVGSRA